MHLGFVSMAVFWLVRLLIRSFRPSVLRRTSDRMIALWPALAAAAIYALIAGFAVPPIWRSMLMLTLCLTAACCYRSPDQLSVLAGAAFIILVIDPNSLRQISFQLTFVCMFAIFSLYPRFRNLRLSNVFPALGRKPAAMRILHPFEEAFWVSIAVNVLVLPLTVYYFQGISLAGFAANVVMVPAVGFVVLPMGLLSIALYAVNEHIAVPFLVFGGWCLKCCEAVILWFSSLSWAFFWVGSMPLCFLAAIYALLALGMAPSTSREPWRNPATSITGPWGATASAWSRYLPTPRISVMASSLASIFRGRPPDRCRPRDGSRTPTTSLGPWAIP
jgi:competence protein ComEC